MRNKLQDGLFDLCVIDECAQSIEPACWIAVQHAKKLVMAGDHKQLDPTVKSQAASQHGLSKSIFERVMEFKGDKTSTMLVEQYRMNEDIMAWSSRAMYNGKLVAHDDVKDRSIAQLVKADEEASDLLSNPLLIIDTAGSLMHEGVESERKQTDEDDQTRRKKASLSQLSESKYNDGEADLVMQVLIELHEELALSLPDIGIISPYSAQVNLLKKMCRKKYGMLAEKLEISTVDGFQGREKEVIIISMVRSNPKHEIGFLSNERRMNVAVTRAKRLCAIVCDSGTIGKNKFLKELADYFKKNGTSRSAYDYQGNADVRIGYGDKTGAIPYHQQSIEQASDAPKLSQA